LAAIDPDPLTTRAPPLGQHGSRHYDGFLYGVYLC
jgi:hypothetical protein